LTKSSPHLWYTDKADEAAAFYGSIFPDARVAPPVPRGTWLARSSTAARWSVGRFAAATMLVRLH